MAYNDLIQDTNIIRSMSRAGKPTDNPVNEALNGRAKEELFIGECRSLDEVKSVLDRYVKFYNEQRPCYVVGYDTPVNYRKRYYKGELERKNSSIAKISYVFANKILTSSLEKTDAGR